MQDNTYTYIPEVDCQNEDFSCKAEIDNTDHVYLIDGVYQQQRDKSFSFHLQKSESVEKIQQAIFVRSKEDPKELSYQGDILLEENSSGRLLLCAHTASSFSFSTLETINIDLKENANLNLVLMQNENNNSSHSTRFNVDIAKGASLKLVIVSLHGGSISNSIKLSLNGEHSQCDISGLYLMDSEQRIENSLEIVHQVPNCFSSQLFKGILDDSSVGKFTGLIKVVKDAQKTEAYQANHNLIISPKAKINSEPQLEIYADDVKCSHGATTGRLDENETFYMRSRGISKKQAKILQQLAFAHEVLEKISILEIKERVTDLTEKRLRGEFSRCGGCTNHCC